MAPQATRATTARLALPLGEQAPLLGPDGVQRRGDAVRQKARGARPHPIHQRRVLAGRLQVHVSPQHGDALVDHRGHAVQGAKLRGIVCDQPPKGCDAVGNLTGLGLGARAHSGIGGEDEASPVDHRSIEKGLQRGRCIEHFQRVLDEHRRRTLLAGQFEHPDEQYGEGRKPRDCCDRGPRAWYQAFAVRTRGLAHGRLPANAVLGCSRSSQRTKRSAESNQK
jgi:hypothetical protein